MARTGRAVAVVAVVVGGVAARRLMSRPGTRRVATVRGLASMPNPARKAGAAARERWHAVTVNRPPEALKPDGRLPEPLARLEDRVEVRITPAPGGKGTELAARLIDPGRRTLRQIIPGLGDGDDPVQHLRSALRETKQLIETGEVLSAHRPTTARRTPLNRPLEAVIQRAGGEGRL
jgi:hypothetical protein